MNSFISFDNAEKIEYFFSKQHFIILLISLVIIIFFSMYASRQRFKFQKRFVIVTNIFILLMEAGRIVWRYFYLQHNNEELTFLNITNLDFFTLALWVSIPLIFLACIVKSKHHNKNSFGLTFVYSVCSIIAIINLIYPSFLNGYFEFYHIYNLLSVLLRSLIIMLGFFFAFSKWIYMYKFLSFWKSFFDLIAFGLICIAIYFLLGQPNNLFYLEYVPMFETLGIYLNFPLQFILIGIFIFALQFLFFIPFYIYRRVKYKD